MVEFALVLPVLLMVILGLIEFGRLMFIYSAVTSASREASRYGASIGPGPNGDPRYRECEAIRSQALRVGQLVGVAPGDVYINYDRGPEGTPPPGIPTPMPNCPQEAGLGDRIIVEVRGLYNPLPAAPLVGLVNFEFRSISRRTIIKDAAIQQAGTAIGSLDTETPLPTVTPGGPTNTPTLTPTITPTLSGPTPTATPTPTPVPPGPPLFVSVNWTPVGQKCNDVIFTWEPNPAWATYPGASPLQYEVFKNGFNAIGPPPGDPGPTVWATGDQLIDNSVIKYDVLAVFSGPLRSVVLTKEYLCQNGNLVDTSLVLDVVVDIVIPGVDGIVITDISQTQFEAFAWDAAVGTNNGDGIQTVYFEITGPGGIVVLIEDEFFVQYCIFGNNGPCDYWDDSAFISFEDAPNGTYTIRARALSTSGIYTAWETRTFELNKP